MSVSRSNRVIVLVHGLGAHRMMMSMLAMRFARWGNQVLNWGYWSIGRTIEKHGTALAAQLVELDQDDSVDEICLVGHSMGGIVARTAIAQKQPKKLHRMVMLAPPNRGSHWATFFGPMLKPFCRTVDQLATRSDSYVNLLAAPPPGLEIGVIAAEYDVLVPREHTRFGYERDHLVWPFTMHTGVLFRRGVARQVRHFLDNGVFRRDEALMKSA